MARIMDEIVNKLSSNRDESVSKSYIIGLERGRIWASDYADYFDMRRFSELDGDDHEFVDLPDNEELHFTVLKAEAKLEYRHYFRGWVEGVKEILNEYR